MKPVVLLALLPSLLSAELPTVPGAEPKLVAEGCKFTEGPATDAKGNVFFTDQPNDRILRWDHATGEVTTFLQPAGRSNGLYFDHDGSLVACADEHGQLWRIDVETKKHEVILDSYDDKLFNGPNDVWIDPAGGMYFTDPFYKRPYWKDREQPEQEKQRVYHLPKGASKPLIADDTLVQPNGIIGSADGKLLYVADIKAGKTWRYRIAADGILEDKTLFCEMGSDGMTLDASGNLYLTGKGVTVFSPDGTKLGNIPIPESWTANITLAGPDRKTLFITAMDSAYPLPLR